MTGRRSLSDVAGSAGVLQGKRVLVTRAREQADDLVHRLVALGAVPIVFPTIQIVPPADGYAALDAALRNLSTFDWVVFTSVNGVVHVCDRLSALGLDMGIFAAVRLATIGPATAEALAARGAQSDVTPERYIAEALLDAIPHVAGKRFLLARADLARDRLRTGLQEAGAEVVDVHAYRTVGASPDADAQAALDNGVDLLTFTSSSTVRHFVAQIGYARAQALCEQGRVVVIGPITAQTVQEFGLRVDAVASTYTISGLVEALIEACR